MYKILSWDVGIKNLAYCILEKRNLEYVITKWDIIDIIDSRNVSECHIEKCKNPAKYSCIVDDVEYFYCGTHKSKHNKLSENWENKYVSSELHASVCDHTNTKKKKCGKKTFYKLTNGSYMCTAHKKSYINKIKKDSEMKEIKNKKCNNFTPYDISHKMYSKLDLIPELLEVNEVLIENQPALKNPPLKSVGSFLYGYFVMRGVIDKERTNSCITKVSFISPSNKLKVNNDKTLQTLTTTKSGDKYKITKKLAVEYTKIILQNNDKWITHLNKYKKKDDLCDALLQGYHYMYFKLDKRKSLKLESDIENTNTNKNNNVTNVVKAT